MNQDQVVLRALSENDRNFVLDSWRQSYRRFNKYRDHKALREHLIDNSTILVMHPRKNREQILGWICWSTNVTFGPWLHYIYVKNPFRRRGLGSLMLAAAGWPPKAEIVSSHVTYAGDFLRLHHHPFAEFPDVSGDRSPVVLDPETVG